MTSNIGTKFAQSSRKVFRAVTVAGLVAVCGASVAQAQNQPSISDICAYGQNLLFIGKDSVVNGNVASNGGVEMRGGAGVNGDVHSGGGVNTSNNVSILGNIFDIGLVSLGAKTLVSGNIDNKGDTKTTGNNINVVGVITHPAGTLVTFSASSSFGGNVIGTPAAPFLPGLPVATVFPVFSGPNTTTGASQSLSLNPGNHGNILIGKSNNLTFQAGTYYIKSLEIGVGTTITFNGPVNLNIEGNFTVRQSVTVVSTSATATDPGVSVEVHGNFVQAGGGNWVGNMFVPFGQIKVGSGGSVNDWFGYMYALDIDLEHKVTVDCPPPGTDPEEPNETPGKDSTVAHGRKNANEGGSPIITVGTQIYGVVGFTLPAGNFTKATLQLTVDPTVYGPGSGPASGWGPNGKLVGVYALDEDFVEGNGFKLGLNVSFPGTGVGVTYNCGADQDISNESKECLLPGIYSLKTAANPTDTFLHTNGMTGVVTFDVTADVLAGKLNWLIKKAQSGSGEVHYYSKEGAATAGNPALAPKLILQ